MMFNFRYSISELPSTPGFRPRLADVRVGHFFAAADDFTTDATYTPTRRYITRWHVEKQDPMAPVSPPTKPIVFWMENTIPVKYRDAVRQGALLWNKAFEKVGFRDAIEVRQQQDEDFDPEDINYNTFRWITTDVGFAMGPFRMGDLAGLDVGWYIRKRHYAEHPELPRAVVADKVCELGRYGQKTGKGWYAYKPGDRTAYPDPEVEKIIADARKAAGITPRKISDAEIVERLVFALVNEGARILEEGIALRASDIDMVYLTGYGFPPYRGGPMFYADQVGLEKVLASIQKFQAGYQGSQWQPAALLVKLAREGKRFNA